MIKTIKYLRWEKIIRKSKLFDSEYYLFTYPDVKKEDLDPVTHYVRSGAKEGKNPNANFNTIFYLEEYPDVKNININPFFHYITDGKTEGRHKNKFDSDKHLININNCFDIHYYLNTYPDIEQAGIDPLEHFILYGFKEGRNPSKNFNTKFYIDKYAIEENVNPLIHFLKFGKELGFKTYYEDQVSNKQVIPYYFDETKTEKYFKPDGRIAIHVYISEINNFQILLNRFKKLEEFDLFLSLQENIEINDVEAMLKSHDSNINNIFLNNVPASINDLEALIVQYGKHLLEYKYIGHFHTNYKNTTYIDLLLDFNGDNSDTILNLLQKDAKIIYAEDENQPEITDPTGWYGNFDKAKIFLANYPKLNIKNFETIDSSQTSMFWATSKCLKDFLSLDKDATNSPELLKQLLLILSIDYAGNIYRIHKGNTLKDYCYYEEQKDYSSSIKHKNIKVLSYYLGQFHPIPENDEWHGEGFTEWTNVKRSYPLFEGHYQQHIPHQDLGYYMLDNPEILKKQAEMMKKSGVYGQIFYHYWFTGKLILEKPVQMLLENKDIDMPFCFCWANENWTRRWDGEDDDVLLGQVYSKEDAKGFIQHLIPFFQDSRYIRIDDRPVLYIYRCLSMPDPLAYIKIWSEECEKVGIPTPYLVTVLTRGATNPDTFGMDAAVERVLFDWTDGTVPDISSTLNTYNELTGSIIDYAKVADFYEDQTQEKDFIYFRSLVPQWDNTARYQEGAYALHKSTPKRFQTWFENLIGYTERTLDADKQFIVVNAWNEWAEGAHLEPDTYYGYSYLNSIGRALSNKEYNDEKTKTKLPINSKIHITMSSSAQSELQEDNILKKQFMYCLSSSSIFKHEFSFYSDVDLLIEENVSIVNGEKDDNDIVIHFQNISLFDTQTIENMLNKSLSYKNSIIISNTYGDETIYDISENNSIDAAALYKAGIHITRKNDSKNVRICLSARCFLAYANSQALPEVTTIIRFHKSGELNELKNALFCLCVMQDVRVTVLIAAQDLDKETKEKLNALFKELPLKDINDVNITYFNSPNGDGDLRTQMMNESLLNAKTRYVTFLDYDDVLFPTAYSYMLMRLKETKKVVSFGRVYYTSYNNKRSLITKREKKFEYGYTYAEFINHNHAPLHSFLLDLEGLDLSKIVYHMDQLYMEDYYLTLQLFTQDNADWESLADNVYIGDYIHCTDRVHTLAINCDNERFELLSDSQYQKDDQRITELRKK
jgi:lipopolysaccharide biosynthesis protein